jgi:hypothetical protein
MCVRATTVVHFGFSEQREQPFSRAELPFDLRRARLGGS